MSAAMLVLGATGVVGRGIVAAAVEAGMPVVAVARNTGELAHLQAAHPDGNVVVLTGSVANEAGSAELAAALRGLGRPLSGVVAAVSGPSGRGRILDQPAGTLRCALDAELLPHLAAARHLLPLLAEDARGGSYVLIGGPAGTLPWAGYGHHSIAAAAVRMLACVLHDEARSLGVRVQLLAVDAPVGEPGQAHACPQWPTAIAIGRRAVALVQRSDARDAAQAIVPYAPKTPPATASHADAQTNERWQQDARRLLHSLTSSSSNASEVFPHDYP